MSNAQLQVVEVKPAVSIRANAKLANIVCILFLAVYAFPSILYSRLACPPWAQMALHILVHSPNRWLCASLGGGGRNCVYLYTPFASLLFFWLYTPPFYQDGCITS